MSRQRIRGRGLAGGGFSPASLPGLLVWLEADTGVLTDVDGIYQWTDLSGNGNHALQATGSRKPSVAAGVLNSLDVVDLDGIDDLVTITSITLTTFTILIVFRATANGLVFEHSPESNLNDGCYMYTATNQSIFANRSLVTTAKDRALDWGLGDTWRVVRNEYGGTHATHKMFIAGVEQSMTSKSSGDPGSGAATDEFNIGARSGAAVPMTGQVASVIICSPVLSAADAASAETYITTKYAL